jgi:hypothetical protein
MYGIGSRQTPARVNHSESNVAGVHACHRRRQRIDPSVWNPIELHADVRTISTDLGLKRGERETTTVDS